MKFACYIGECLTFVTFSKRTVWRQLRCLPRSVFSGGAVESSCGIQPVHASSSSPPDGGEEIRQRKRRIDPVSSSRNEFRNSIEFSLPSYLTIRATHYHSKLNQSIE